MRHLCTRPKYSLSVFIVARAPLGVRLVRPWSYLDSAKQNAVRRRVMVVLACSAAPLLITYYIKQLKPTAFAVRISVGILTGILEQFRCSHLLPKQSTKYKMQYNEIETINKGFDPILVCMASPYHSATAFPCPKQCPISVY